jgi:hypothetical protein
MSAILPSSRFVSGPTKNGQYKETGNIGYTRRRKTKQKHNTIFVRHHYTQTNINNAEIAYVDINPCIRDEVPLVSYNSLHTVEYRFKLTTPVCLLIKLTATIEVKYCYR